MSAKDFHIGDVLSITTGRLVSPDGMAGIYNILNHMTGESLFTHQLPRVSIEAAQVLLRRFPQLYQADAGDVTQDNWRQWLDTQEARFGKTLSIEPMDWHEHVRTNPIEELEGMVGKDRVVMVRP